MNAGKGAGVWNNMAVNSDDISHVGVKAGINMSGLDSQQTTTEDFLHVIIWMNAHTRHRPKIIDRQVGHMLTSFHKSSSQSFSELAGFKLQNRPTRTKLTYSARLSL